MISEISPSAFSLGDSTVGETGELDAPGLHHQRASDLQIAGELEHGAAVKDRAPRLRRGKTDAPGHPEAFVDASERLGGDKTTDHALAVIGLEAVDPHIVEWQPVPNRQQLAGDDMKAALGKFRDAGAFGIPKGGKFFDGGLAPVRALEIVERENVTRHWPDQARARLDAAVIVHQAGGGDLTAARCDCSLISSRPPGARAASSASARGRGRLRSLRSTGSSVFRRRPRHGCAPSAVR